MFNFQELGVDIDMIFPIERPAWNGFTSDKPDWNQPDMGFLEGPAWPDLPVPPAQYPPALDFASRGFTQPASTKPSPPREKPVQRWNNEAYRTGFGDEGLELCGGAFLSARDSVDESKKGPKRPNEKVNLPRLSTASGSNANAFQIRKPARKQKKVKEYKNPHTAAFKKFEAEELAKNPDAFTKEWFARQPPPKKKRNNYRQNP
ncbi:hypothetical protein FQN52_001728 [Onygenales sp. PD_12]|nr:hypothetical protein FQN52_001728 [Onygenales sp. PD_12]